MTIDITQWHQTQKYFEENIASESVQLTADDLQGIEAIMHLCIEATLIQKAALTCCPVEDEKRPAIFKTETSNQLNRIWLQDFLLY